MRETTKRVARSNGHALTNDWLKIKSAFSDTAVDVKGKAESMITDSVAEMKKKSARMQTKVGIYVAKKPLKTLGITLLIGMAVGFLLRR